jgi:amino acid transporter
VLTLTDSVALVVGVVVGAGIFRLPSLVAGELGDETLVMAAWVAGGVISLIGALCFAELSTAFPHAGGEYHFLSRAYGRGCGFMFAWSRITVVQTGSIALLAYIFGDYAAQLLPIGPHGAALYAAASVLLTTGLNIAGIRQTATVQKILFVTTLVGLACVIATGLFAQSPSDTVQTAPNPGDGAGSFGLAMVFVLLTYGGWNEAAYLSAEVRDHRRNTARMLIVSVCLITVLYVTANLAYIEILGIDGMMASDAVASDLMGAVFGEWGARFISVLVLFVLLASINVTTLTGARTTFALGYDFRLFRIFRRWSDEGSAPVTALVLQAAIVLGLIVMGALDRSGVETLIDYLSPVFWLFFLLTGVSLFVLRRHAAAANGAFRVPFYPLTALLFCLASAYLLYASLRYTGTGAAAGLVVLLSGLPVYAWARRMERKTTAGSRPASRDQGDPS